MSSFVENEADESSADEQEGSPTKIKKKNAVIQSDSEDEEEEDDEQKLREEMKDLINDDDEDDGSSGSSSGSGSGSSSSGEESEPEKENDSARQARKRRHRDFDDNLEDEDYDLIEENLGVKVQRKKILKRVALADDDDDDEEREKDKDSLAQELFEDGEGDHEGHGAHADQDAGADEEMGSESGSEDDVNDFIVDDDGQPITKQKKKRHVKYLDSALQEAQEIFGVDFDYDDVQGYNDEYDGSEDEEEDYEDEEEADATVKKTKAKKKAQGKKSIFEVFEPIELERGHFTDRDQEIRATDEPERFQLRAHPLTPANETELAEESEWIYRQCFQNPTISVQKSSSAQDANSSDRASGHQPIGGQKSRTCVAKIAEALKFMRNMCFEVPFIAFYRKEYVQPDLTINDLWLIYKWDERWCQLRQQKTNMEKLFKKMQEFICEQILSDDSASKNLRQLEENDFERLRDAQTPEELKDVYLNFLLYYAQDLPAMQESNLLKRKQKREEERRKKQERIANGEEDAGDDDADDDDVDDEQFLKRSRKKDCFAVCRELGLHELAKKFGLTPQQFGENLRDNYQRHEVVQFPVQPMEVAGEYVNDRLSNSTEVLKAARYMDACELARDPTVRRCVRETFFERAKLCVQPTKKGIKEIDESHPCYALKYLKNKPVRSLVNDQFLKLSLAEEEKLIKISITMDGVCTNESATYVHEVRQLYHRDEFSKNVQEWNSQREEALTYALTKFLYPTFEKELKLRLLRESHDYVLRSSAKRLYNWLKIAPYVPPESVQEEEDFDTREGVRILAIAFQDDYNVAAFGALINGDGEVTDYLRLEHLLKRRTARRDADRLGKLSDMQKLKKFLLDKKPHCVVVSAESRDALSVKADVELAIKELVDEEQFPQLQVMLLDNGLAIVYSNSKRAEQDFREYPPLLKQAVSLARRTQDPLTEFSQLCGPDEEILCLKYHAYQDNVPKDELQWTILLELINRTNEVGVDINRCVDFSHTSALLQFVSGLGPRKAYALIKTLKQTNSKLEDRSHLVTKLKLGPNIFLNCAGFIRLDTSSFENTTDGVAEVLDGTRIHPEMYESARKMATDALDYDDMDDANMNPAEALEEIMENPEKLKDLDLDAFAVELERQNYGLKSITLYDIRAELSNPYKDLRIEYVQPEKEILFNLLTKETPETFFVGKLITCQVSGIARKKPQGDQLDQANPIRNDESGLWQCPFCLKSDFPELSEVWNHFDAGNCPGQAMGVRIRLDNGVNGFIPTKNLSDRKVSNPEDRVTVGQIIHGRITKIDIDRFSVDITSKSSDLADKNGEWKPPKDIYYDIEAEDKERKKHTDVQKIKQRQTYVKRVIVHPSFHNVSFKQAVELLTKLDQGESVIRPSSKGVNHLTVTWKVYKDILQHIDVEEKGKENSFSLGSSLVIDNEEFECLDEILARHVQPMSGFVREITQFRYFQEFDGGKKEVADKWLQDEKRKAPAKIPYAISPSVQYPGKFLLSYQPSSKPRHEFVTVTPDGFRYRQQVFHSVNALFRWFKEHFRDPIPLAAASATPGAQSVSGGHTGNPYMTPGLATPSGRLSVVPMIMATPGLATPGARTPGARTPGSVVAPAYGTAYTAQSYGTAYAGSTSYAISTGAMTPQPMQISTTPGYVTPGYSSTPAVAAVPSSMPSPGPRAPSARTPRPGQGRPAPGKSAEEWKKMAFDWANNHSRDVRQN